MGVWTSRISRGPIVAGRSTRWCPSRTLPHANWLATVSHGLPERLLRFSARAGRYLAFLGRMAPEKRPDRAIRVAQRAGMRLRMAAKVDPVDKGYFESGIAPLLAGGGAEFIGEITEDQKSDF